MKPEAKKERNPTHPRACTECGESVMRHRGGGFSIVMEPGPNDEAGKPPSLCSKCWRAGL